MGGCVHFSRQLKDVCLRCFVLLFVFVFVDSLEKHHSVKDILFISIDKLRPCWRLQLVFIMFGPQQSKIPAKPLRIMQYSLRAP